MPRAARASTQYPADDACATSKTPVAITAPGGLADFYAAAALTFYDNYAWPFEPGSASTDFTFGYNGQRCYANVATCVSDNTRIRAELDFASGTLNLTATPTQQLQSIMVVGYSVTLASRSLMQATSYTWEQTDPDAPAPVITFAPPVVVVTMPPYAVASLEQTSTVTLRFWAQVGEARGHDGMVGI